MRTPFSSRTGPGSRKARSTTGTATSAGASRASWWSPARGSVPQTGLAAVVLPGAVALEQLAHQAPQGVHLRVGQVRGERVAQRVTEHPPGLGEHSAPALCQPNEYHSTV